MDLFKIYEYSQDTGILFHKKRNPSDFPDSKRISSETRCLQWNKMYSGKPAGWICSDGYVRVVINYKQYLAHRIIWKMVFGDFPSFFIDHKNGIRSDNRIENLRDASQSENMKNQKLRSDNKSGISGVSWHKQRGKWAVRVTATNGKYKSGGLYDNLDDAINKRNELVSMYGYTGRHGLNG